MPATTPPDAARKLRLGKPAVSGGWVPEAGCESCVGILFSFEEVSIGELRARCPTVAMPGSQVKSWSAAFVPTSARTSR
jgi:hypothetical protein